MKVKPRLLKIRKRMAKRVKKSQISLKRLMNLLTTMM